MKQAGGSQKLVRLEWADARLSEFNRNVDAAHTEYFLFCFYGAAGRSPTEISRRHVEAKRFAESLE
jgi:hypothetical protein